MELNITLTKIGSSENPFPMVSNVWDFFIAKGIKTVFFSVGTTESPLAELDFAEMIGCPIHIFESNQIKLNQWTSIQEILKSRKVGENTDLYVKDCLKKWVLPRNIHTHLYSSFDEITDSIPTICTTMGIENDAHIDLLKINLHRNEISVLNRILEKGYRPSLLLVSWTEKPDDGFLSMCAAGNLCMLGYILVGKEGNNFLYYFGDSNYYEVSRFEETQKTTENVIVKTLVRAVVDGLETPKNKGGE